jgi:hypothetical protein
MVSFDNHKKYSGAEYLPFKVAMMLDEQRL